MALMSRKVDYALLILSHLHRKPEGACAREMADHFGLSRSFVANILKDICHHGFVSSHRGVKGGYVLARSAKAISLADLMDALDDPFHLAECTRPQEECTCTLTAVCPVRDPIAAVHQRIRDLLRTVTLAELFKSDLPQPAQAVQVGVAACAAEPQARVTSCADAPPVSAADEKVLAVDI
jgi:Rrf2 family protein